MGDRRESALIPPGFAAISDGLYLVCLNCVGLKHGDCLQGQCRCDCERARAGHATAAYEAMVRPPSEETPLRHANPFVRALGKAVSLFDEFDDPKAFATCFSEHVEYWRTLLRHAPPTNEAQPIVPPDTDAETIRRATLAAHNPEALMAELRDATEAMQKSANVSAIPRTAEGKRCEPGAWGGAGCLRHEGHEIGPDGFCIEGRPPSQASKCTVDHTELLEKLRKYVAVAHAARMLIAANDEAQGAFRPRPDIAWRDLKAVVALLPEGEEP